MLPSRDARLLSFLLNGLSPLAAPAPPARFLGMSPGVPRGFAAHRPCANLNMSGPSHCAVHLCALWPPKPAASLRLMRGLRASAPGMIKSCPPTPHRR
jgi:hypothetical protein